MVLGMAAEHSTFDPAFAANSSDLNVIDQVYEQLVEHNPDLTFQPLLAESWSFNDALDEWTFYLRRGVKFSDGSAMNATDVVYSFNRLRELESPGVGALSMVEQVVKVDSDTVRFELNSPTAFFLDSLALVYHYKILPSDVDSSRFQEELIGTGAFVMVENIIGERTVFEKNPNYWWTGYPYLDELVFQYLPDPTSRLEALKAGDTHYHRYMPVTEVAEVDAHPDLRSSIVGTSGYVILGMDPTQAPFDNKLIRQAVQAITDRDAINAAAFLGRGSIGNDHPIPPFDPHFNGDVRPPAYDPALACSLVNQAGYDRIDLQLHTSTNPGAPMMAVATVMEEKATAGCIDIEVVVMPEATYWSEVWLVKPFYTSYWAGRTPDAALGISVHSSSDWADGKLKGAGQEAALARVDELIELARTQSELADRRVTYGELQEILIEEVVRIVPVHQLVINGMANDVRGLESDPGAWFWSRYAYWAE
jgi:peptide/nickel transport system substrate-binding protein